MEDNPYRFAPEVASTGSPVPPRTLQLSRAAHILLMLCQLGFWAWIVYDQRQQWQARPPLLIFFIAMIVLFAGVIIAVTLCRTQTESILRISGPSASSKSSASPFEQRPAGRSDRLLEA